METNKTNIIDTIELEMDGIRHEIANYAFRIRELSEEEIGRLHYLGTEYEALREEQQHHMNKFFAYYKTE